jgi:hypothetical protein
MRIQMLRSTIVDLKQVSVGDIVETSDQASRLLIGIGKAMAAPVTHEVVITDQDPQPATLTPKRRKTNDPQPWNQNDPR